MNKAFYIVGIVFSVVFLFVTGYYTEEVQSARFDEIFSSFNSYDPYGYSSYSSYSSGRAESLTTEAGIWSIFFFLCFIAIDLLGLLKVKTKTIKVISIIGLALSGIFLIWNMLMLASPGSISFSEVSGGWVFYCFVMIAFTIVGLVQSVRYSKRRNGGQPSTTGGDLLDS